MGLRRPTIATSILLCKPSTSGRLTTHLIAKLVIMFHIVMLRPRSGITPSGDEDSFEELKF